MKIHTWFPLTMQVYVNGHDFLAKKLDHCGVAYTRCDNTFTAVAGLLNILVILDAYDTALGRKH